jgi:hypothetical protein
MRILFLDAEFQINLACNGRGPGRLADVVCYRYVHEGGNPVASNRDWSVIPAKRRARPRGLL